MSYVVDKRPVEVIEHALDFTSALAAGETLASATVKVVGDGEAVAALTATVAVADPLATVTLSAGTASTLYQVYVTGTGSAGTVKRLQFEVRLTADPEGTP